MASVCRSRSRRDLNSSSFLHLAVGRRHGRIATSFDKEFELSLGHKTQFAGMLGGAGTKARRLQALLPQASHEIGFAVIQRSCQPSVMTVGTEQDTHPGGVECRKLIRSSLLVMTCRNVAWALP